MTETIAKNLIFLSLQNKVKDVTPCLTRVTRDVDAREKELTHTLHREILIRCLDSVKTLAPILICSMKIFIQLKTEAKITNEANENRNYLNTRMVDESKFHKIKF